MEITRERLIDAGVRNLRDFGYPSVNKDNILTEDIFKRFFLSMLKDSDNAGKGADQAISSLIAEIEGMEQNV